jgi:stalled ribosome alternative rescue factor ArfA
LREREWKRIERGKKGKGKGEREWRKVWIKNLTLSFHLVCIKNVDLL